MREVKFEYRTAESVQAPIMAHGAVGGLTQAGTVVAHIYSEYVELPRAEVVTIHDDESKTKKFVGGGDRRNKKVVIRAIQASLMMPPEVAVSVGKWLIKNGEESLAKRKELEQGS